MNLDQQIARDTAECIKLFNVIRQDVRGYSKYEYEHNLKYYNKEWHDRYENIPKALEGNIDICKMLYDMNITYDELQIIYKTFWDEIIDNYVLAKNSKEAEYIYKIVHDNNLGLKK